jgi:hypothetical protein
MTLANPLAYLLALFSRVDQPTRFEFRRQFKLRRRTVRMVVKAKEFRIKPQVKSAPSANPTNRVMRCSLMVNFPLFG